MAMFGRNSKGIFAKEEKGIMGGMIHDMARVASAAFALAVFAFVVAEI